MRKPSIYTIWYIECNSRLFLIKLGWGKIHGNVFSDTAFLKDTLIGINGKFSWHWFAHKTFHRCFKWDIFVSNDNTRNEFKEKCWVMSFTDPCDVSDDVIPDHVKIGTCDMLSVFPCVRFILNRRLLLKPLKEHQMIVFCHMVVRTQYLVQYSDPVQYPHKKAIQSPVANSP